LEEHIMATMKMTRGAVERLPAPDPSGRQTIYWAEGAAMQGLGILVSGVSASKSWVCQGNLPSGKSRRITLGPVAQLTIEEAWELARPKLAAMLQGRDPKLTGPQRQLAAMTVAEVLDAFLANSSNLRPSTIALYRAYAKHLAPLADRPMREIEADEVERLFRHITSDVVRRRAAGKIVGGTNVQGKAIANSAIRLLGTIWAYQAERDRDLPPNPVQSRRFARQWHDIERRTRHVPPERLAEFYQAARRLRSDIQRDLVIVGLFTGLRDSEVSGLRWDEVDLANKMLRLPAGRMKARKAFDLPMSDIVYRILVTRRAIGREGAHVFPGYGATGHCRSFNYALDQIRDGTGIATSPHDLRRTFLSVVEQSEISPLCHKLLVAHSTGGDVTSGYKQISLSDLRAAAQKVADRMKVLCGITEPAGENIVQIA
jgi:integrase